MKKSRVSQMRGSGLYLPLGLILNSKFLILNSKFLIKN